MNMNLLAVVTLLYVYHGCSITDREHFYKRDFRI